MTYKVTLLILLLLLPVLLFAGPGKIAGKVTDKNSGEPLIGVTVQIVGTTTGASTGVDGSYFILNVPPGTYSIKFSYVGYHDITVSNVTVSADFTTDMNATLTETSIELKEVEIVAERPLIQKDYTNTVVTQTAEQIANLPIRGAINIAGTQASVVQDEASSSLYIRGGRPDEVAYYVDGVSVNNPLSGQASASFAQMNSNAIEELQMQTGGFQAEYGSAMSGVISLTTKQARSNYFGSLEAITDNFVKPGKSLFNSASWGYNVYSGTFGGPILPGSDMLTLFVAGERQFLRDSDPRAIGGIKPNNSLSSWNMNGKMSYKPITPLQFILGGMYYGRTGNIWNGGDRMADSRRLLDPEHQQKFDNATYSGFLKATQNFGQSTFYTVQVNYFREDLESGDGVYFNKLLQYGDTLYNRYLTSQGTNPGMLYSTVTPPGHVLDLYTKSRSEYFGFNGDLTTQQGNHLIKLGGEYKYNTIRRFTVNPMGLAIGTTSTNVDALWQLYRNNNVQYYGYTYDGKFLNNEDKFFDSNGNKVASNDRREAPKHPVYGAFYLQDKVEYSDLVLNLGARLDYFNANEKVFKDPFNAFGARGTLKGGTFDASDLEDSKATITVSPRLGFSFPITDKAVFHAQYGVFLAQPPLQNILVSKTWEDRIVGDSPFSVKIPNPNLRPEKTVAYEFGFRQAITDFSSISITAFYKEVKDLIESRNVQPAYPNGYETFENVDFGTVKGFDVIFELRRTKNLSATLNYTLSYANGTGSNPLTQTRITWIMTESPKVIAPLDFDRRHNGSLNVDYRFLADEGPTMFGVRPLERFGLDAMFVFNSGVPYTQSVLYAPFEFGTTEIRPTGGVNQAYTPWNFRLDLKLDKTFVYDKISANVYIWWINVLGAKNVFNVWRGTGEANNSGYLSTQEGQDWAAANGPQAVSLFKAREADPSNYGVPGQMRFGIRLYY
jgi:outer membrane receptor protein involved in Fe transport